MKPEFYLSNMRPIILFCIQFHITGRIPISLQGKTFQYICCSITYQVLTKQIFLPLCRTGVKAMYRLLGVVHMNPEISEDKWDHTEVRYKLYFDLNTSISTLNQFSTLIHFRRINMALVEYAPQSCSTILLALM